MSEDQIPPTPWTLDLYGKDDHEVWGIRDANGGQVVVTECGIYPPNKATAQLIVDAVNSYADQRKTVEDDDPFEYRPQKGWGS